MNIILMILLIGFSSYSYGSEPDVIKDIRGLYKETNILVQNEKPVIVCTGQQGYYDGKWKTKAGKGLSPCGDKPDVVGSIWVINEKVRKVVVTAKSFTGDWKTTKEYYFYLDSGIAFEFTEVVTMLGYDTDKQEPLGGAPFIVEKREYFNRKGDSVRTLEKAFVSTTKKNIPVQYLKKVYLDTYKNVRDIPFYNLTKIQ